jgi:hypothetical protein
MVDHSTNDYRSRVYLFLDNGSTYWEGDDPSRLVVHRGEGPFDRQTFCGWFAVVFMWLDCKKRVEEEEEVFED